MAINVSENLCNTNSPSERKMLFVEMQPGPVSGISVNVTPCLRKNMLTRSTSSNRAIASFT